MAINKKSPARGSQAIGALNRYRFIIVYMFKMPAA